MKPLLSLCSIPKTATKDGYAGALAKILLPFYGYWFASGAQVTFPRSEIPQDGAITVHGTNMADTFQKDCCTSCLGKVGSGIEPTLPPVIGQSTDVWHVGDAALGISQALIPRK